MRFKGVGQSLGSCRGYAKYLEHICFRGTFEGSVIRGVSCRKLICGFGGFVSVPVDHGTFASGISEKTSREKTDWGQSGF